MITKQDVVYNLSNWPMLVNSRVIVLVVTPQHDLLREIHGVRVRSRVGISILPTLF